MNTKDTSDATEPPATSTSSNGGGTWAIMDPTETIAKSRVTLCCLCLLLIGLVASVVATVASVNTEQRVRNITARLQDSDQARPLTLIGTKFRVPTTNTYSLFNAGVPDNVAAGMKFAKKPLPKKNTKLYFSPNFDLRNVCVNRTVITLNEGTRQGQVLHSVSTGRKFPV